MSSTDEDFSKDAEWLEALETEPNEDIEDTTDDKADNDDASDDDSSKDVPEDGATEDENAEDDKADNTDEAEDDGEKSDDDLPDDTAKKVDDDDKATPPDEDTRIKAAVKEALQETETSKADRSAKIESYRLEVAQKLYPEGLDRQLRDSDGDPITGIDDLTKLINPKTQDYFTEEEAGSWLLSAQQKLNQSVQQVEAFIEEVAETNIALEEGAARVVDKYEKVLTANPELKDRLLAGYNKTLVKDPKTGIAIKAPVDVVEFFDLALEPMLKQQSAEAEAAAKAAKEAEERAKKTRQQERGDLKPNGKAETLKPEDKEWAQAIKEYEEGV